ncbi:MAG TPA: DUF3830 family protein [Chloroflexota bacterium]|jgi:hypothetical protein|nr:DUF3830 family protein [Chloroflexota bacterium]
MGSIRLRVPRYDLDLDLELMPDLAPTTVAALAAALPTTGLLTCENHYGSVLCLRLPALAGPLPPENASVYPIPGDVFIFEREHGAELVVFYERSGGVPAGTPFDARGDKPGNRVGAVATALTPALREAARRPWTDGAAWGAAGPADAPAMASLTDDRAAAAAEIEARRAGWLRRAGRDHHGPPLGRGPRVALVIPEYGARSEVELFDDLAPHSCAHVLSHLPVATTLMHGRYSGPEMFTQVGGKQWHWTPRAENQTVFPIPGDLVLYIDPPPRIQINYFHDRNAVPFGTPRPEPGNLIGRSAGDFSAFAEGCWRVGYEGWKTLVVERPEASHGRGVPR